MEYTDEQQLNWWASLTKYDQLYLLEEMEKTCNPKMKPFVASLMNMYKQSYKFSAKQIAVIRKWDHEGHYSVGRE